MQLGEDLRQHAILSHRQRQAGVAHHQGIEHAKAADHATQGQTDAQQRTAEHAGDVSPRTGFPCAGGKPGQPHGCYRNDVAEGNDDHRRQHGARIGPLRTLHLGRDGGGIVPSHVVPHADEQAAEDVRR